LRSGEAVSFLDGGGEAEEVQVPELHLAVADLAASAAFYEGVLGFAVEAATPDEPPYRRVELAREGMRIVLRRSADLAAELPRTIGSAAVEEAESGPAPPPAAGTGAGSGTATAPGTGKAGPSSVLHVPATDVDALLRRVEQAGTGTARLDEAPDGSRRLSVRAPDGNVRGFVESLGPDPGD
jgi:catechol 2,3-dioxygenase-like lactoylglutathione lyase family enzyme